MPDKWNRIDKAQELVDKEMIEVIFMDETMIQFRVYSLNSRQRSYIISYDGVRFSCLCRDNEKRHADCYHKLGCSYFLRDLRRIELEEEFKCQGTLYGKNGKIE
jgi:hypothetical protein